MLNDYECVSITTPELYHDLLIRRHNAAMNMLREIRDGESGDELLIAAVGYEVLNDVVTDFEHDARKKSQMLQHPRPQI